MSGAHGPKQGIPTFLVVDLFVAQQVRSGRLESRVRELWRHAGVADRTAVFPTISAEYTIDGTSFQPDAEY